MSGSAQLLCTALASLLPTQADTSAPAEAPWVEVSTTSTQSTTSVLSEKRDKPDLDGREEEGPDAGDVLVWVPRVLLAPVHLVFEWGIRKPLGALLTAAEKDDWANVLVDFFTFDDRKVGIVPTFFLDFNFRPSVGLYFFWNEIIVPEHSLRLSVGYGGDDWYRLTVSDRWAIGTRSQFDLTFNLWGRPDYIYSGEGLEAEPDIRGRYFQEFIDGSANLLVRPWRASQLRLEAGIRQNRFRGGSAGRDEVNLPFAISEGVFDEPVAFDDGYVASFQRALVRIDSRENRPKPGSGGMVEAYLLHGWDLENPDGREWMGYGGQLATYWDIGEYRVLSVAAQAHLRNPIGDTEIPFTELFDMGRRPQDLSGFLPGVLRGRSAAVVTLEYTYPVWVFMDAELQVSTGNVFGENFEDFSLGAFRTSIGLGVRSSGDQDNSFSLLVAVGTSRFDESFAIDGFRLLFGSQTGF